MSQLDEKSIRVLMVLAKHTAEISHTQLWRETHLNKKPFQARITELLNNGCIERNPPRDPRMPRERGKRVYFRISLKGNNALRRYHLVGLIQLLPPVEVQVLETLMYLFISYVYIMAPYGTTLEHYIQLLRDKLNREDTLKLALALQNDPNKLYAEFFKHLKEFRSSKLIDYFSEDL